MIVTLTIFSLLLLLLRAVMLMLPLPLTPAAVRLHSTASSVTTRIAGAGL